MADRLLSHMSLDYARTLASEVDPGVPPPPPPSTSAASGSALSKPPPGAVDALRSRAWAGQPLERDTEEAVRRAMEGFSLPDTGVSEWVAALDWRRGSVADELQARGFFSSTRKSNLHRRKRRKYTRASLQAFGSFLGLKRGDVLAFLGSGDGTAALDLCELYPGLVVAGVDDSIGAIRLSKTRAENRRLAAQCLFTCLPRQDWGRWLVDIVNPRDGFVVADAMTCVWLDLDGDALGAVRPFLSRLTSLGTPRILALDCSPGALPPEATMTRRPAEFEPGSLEALPCALWCIPPTVDFVPSARRAHLNVLDQQEDEAFDHEFLGSASNVDEFPDGWCCPFLPSPMERIKRLAELLPLDPGSLVLDLGCGDGRVLTSLAATLVGVKCFGVDIDSGLVERAQTLAQDRGLEHACSFSALDLTSDEAPRHLENLLVAERPSSQSPVFVFLFLVTEALAKIRPLLRALWTKGGVTLVTTGGFHLRDWAYDRGDIAYGLRVIDPAVVSEI
uniref:Methyltransferase domain-containing protein n=1 Tax=Rhizochromulina marina TaxID=1034831 RepID=A0A7S2W988_9STRA